MSKNKLPFIPGWLDDAGLSTAEFRLYCHLRKCADNSTLTAWPSYKTMTKTCGTGKTTNRRCLEELERRGFISKVGKPFGGSCRYHVLAPIVPPEGQMDASNSSATGTIDAAPIVPPQDCNSPPGGTPIVPPQGQEGKPKKVNQKKVNQIPKAEPSEDAILFEYWNAIQDLPMIVKFTDKRKAMLRTRLKEPFFRDNWKTAIDTMAKTPFLTGQGDQGWKANIDWFLKPDSIVMIMEGKYSTTNPKKTAPVETGRRGGETETIYSS